jgi:hypothetical protein
MKQSFRLREAALRFGAAGDMAGPTLARPPAGELKSIGMIVFWLRFPSRCHTGGDPAVWWRLV